MTYRHAGAQPVYAPNAKGGPVADPNAGVDVTWSVVGEELGRYPNARHRDDDDFVQPGTLYREVMDDTDREHLVDNVVEHASDEVTPETQLRVVAYWSAVDVDLGARVAAGLGIDAGNANGDLAAAREEVFAHANHA
ncbi:MAG TPA: catalase-related domain-containing protein [Solirubrobacteraceae bacterium]|nr:catalase-related domain-containing protein [Solirubrobacteraceae bacterium]